MCDLRRWITEIINKQWVLSCLNASLSAFRRSHAFTLTRFSLALIYSLPSPAHPSLSALMTMQHTFQENLCGIMSTGTIKWGTFPQAVDFSLIFRNCISWLLPVFIRVVTSNRLFFFFLVCLGFVYLFVFNKTCLILADWISISGEGSWSQGYGYNLQWLSLDWFFFFFFLSWIICFWDHVILQEIQFEAWDFTPVRIFVE